MFSRELKHKRLLLMTAAIVLAGCSKPPEPRASAPAAAPVRVQAVAPSMGEWPLTYEATGTVRAKNSAVVSSKLMAYVTAVKAQSGDRVREGQPLAVLDSRDLEIAVHRAEAGREEIRSALPEADSAMAAAKSQVDLAQTTLNRLQELLQKKSVSTQEVDEASARLKSAQAAYEMARAKRTQLNSKLAQAEQEVRAAEIQRGYSEIVAPFAGILITKTVEPGTLAVPGSPLFTIEREGSYRLEASVAESHLASIRPGQSVTVMLDGVTRVFQSRVSEIVPVVDEATRVATVKIDLPAGMEVRSGQFGRAQFRLGTQSALTIPTAAVIERGQLQSVFAVENGVARTRLITLGERNGDHVAILSGLTETDRIIVPVPQGLTDGSPVEVRE